MNNYSQTQISNFITFAGIIVYMANQCGVILEQNTVAYVLAAIFTIGGTAYNFYQRYKKGNISLMGRRINN